MQIGSTTWRPENCDYSLLLEPDEYAERIADADVLVMHAGIGSILAAMKHEKPMALPRDSPYLPSAGPDRSARKGFLRGTCRPTRALDSCVHVILSVARLSRDTSVLPDILIADFAVSDNQHIHINFIRRFGKCMPSLL